MLGPHVALPAAAYGGIERVVESLVVRQAAAGLDVGTFTVGSSRLPGRLHWHFPEVPLRHDSAGRRVYDRSDDVVQVGKALAVAGDYDFVHNHTEFALPMLALARVPAVTTLHSYSASGGGLDRLVEAFPDAPSVALSGSQRGLLPPAHRIVATVHNPLPLEVYRAEPRYERGLPTVAFLGSMTHDKGADLAIQAVKRAGRDLVAAGPVSRSHREFFDREVAPLLDGERWRWVGEVGGQRKIDLLRDAAVLLCPARWQEPFGLAAIEAMALGTPVVALRRGALAEIVDDGVTGYLADDPGELPALLGRAEKLDRAQCANEARKRFHPDRAAVAYCRLYEVLHGHE
ncbi:glycosyltransferase [Streptomyces sp. NPDC001142]